MEELKRFLLTGKGICKEKIKMGTRVDLLCFLFIAFTLLFVICHSEDFVDTTYSHLLAELPYAIIFSSVVFIFL